MKKVLILSEYIPQSHTVNQYTFTHNQL